MREEAHAPPQGVASSSTADLLSRFRVGASREEPAAHERAEAEEAPARRGPATAAPREAAHDEDSIDDYMARLMERLGAKGAATQQPAAPEAPRRPSTAPQREPEYAEPAPEPARMLRDPSEMTPRAVAPESSSDLLAMRELAILNARAAIDLHERQTLMQRFFSKAFTSFVAAVATVLLIWFYLQGHQMALPLALLALAASVTWGWQYLRLRRSSRRRRFWTENASAAPDVGRNGLPPSAPATGETADSSQIS
jgi:hypothetical protein